MSAPVGEEAVAYLLDELEDSERAAFEARLAAQPDLRAEVEALRPVMGRLERMDSAVWEAPAPPPPPAVPGADASPAHRASRTRRWSRRRLALPAWGLAAAACVLLALGVAGGILVGDEGGDAPGGPAAPAIALRPVGGESGASGRIRLGRNEAAVRITGLAAAPAGDYYELWLLTSPTDLISLGSFRVSAAGEAALRVPMPVDPRAFRYVDVSLEPGDGDTSHSQRSVLRAPTGA